MYDIIHRWLPRLVDPSCSGSGLPEHHLDANDATPKRRLERLASFQRRILCLGRPAGFRIPIDVIVLSICITSKGYNGFIGYPCLILTNLSSQQEMLHSGKLT